MTDKSVWGNPGVSGVFLIYNNDYYYLLYLSRFRCVYYLQTPHTDLWYLVRIFLMKNVDLMLMNVGMSSKLMFSMVKH
jgi:hypothetical protein